jgi:hypothetical protein
MQLGAAASTFYALTLLVLTSTLVLELTAEETEPQRGKAVYLTSHSQKGVVITGTQLWAPNFSPINPAWSMPRFQLNNPQHARETLTHGLVFRVTYVVLHFFHTSFLLRVHTSFQTISRV